MDNSLETKKALKILNKRRNKVFKNLTTLLETASEYPKSHAIAISAIAEIDKEWNKAEVKFSDEKIKAFFLNQNISVLENIIENLKHDLKKEKACKAFEKSFEPIYFSYQRAVIERNRLDAPINNLIDHTTSHKDIQEFRDSTWKNVEALRNKIDAVRKKLNGPIKNLYLPPQEEGELKSQIALLNGKNDIAKEIKFVSLSNNRVATELTQF